MTFRSYTMSAWRCFSLSLIQGLYRRMKINYFSDLHLEFGKLEQPANDADIIVAAGDIGPGLMGLHWLRSLNKPVIYIAGNHEFYGTELEQALADLRRYSEGTQVYFLENESVIVQGVRFVGCTLWTDLFRQGEDKVLQLQLMLNDFRKIRYQETSFSPEHYSQLHHVSHAWLVEKLAHPFMGKTVVVTHHAPSKWSWDGEHGALREIAYCNDLDCLQHSKLAELWIHGHIHNVTEYDLVGGKVVCNPRGYKGFKLAEGFDVNRIIEI